MTEIDRARPATAYPGYSGTAAAKSGPVFLNLELFQRLGLKYVRFENISDFPQSREGSVAVARAKTTPEGRPLEGEVAPVRHNRRGNFCTPCDEYHCSYPTFYLTFLNIAAAACRLGAEQLTASDF
jgi:hypothetical protein